MWIRVWLCYKCILSCSWGILIRVKTRHCKIYFLGHIRLQLALVIIRSLRISKLITHFFLNSRYTYSTLIKLLIFRRSEWLGTTVKWKLTQFRILFPNLSLIKIKWWENLYFRWFCVVSHHHFASLHPQVACIFSIKHI